MLGTLNRRTALIVALAFCLGLGSCKKDDDKPTGPPPIVPELYLVLPSGGTVLGGNTVALFTRNFTDLFSPMNLPDIFFGTVQVPSVDITIVTPVEMFVVVPPGLSQGPVDVSLTSKLVVETATCSGCYTYGPPPICTVTGVSPRTGDVSGGETVTITGIDFVPNPTVTFGTEVARYAIYLGPATLETEAPPAAGGLPATVDVVVSFPNSAICSFTSGYDYTVPQCNVDSITPNSGSTAGVEPVTIDGQQFDPLATVDFDGVPATNVSWVSPTRITCDTPPRAAPGVVTVQVNNPGVSCNLSSSFTYYLAGGCDLLSIVPAGGNPAGGYNVTIRGNSFDDQPPPPDVRFGFMPSANVVQVSSTELTVEVPSGAVGVVDVTVTNQSSGQGCSLTGAFEYLGIGQCGLYSVEPGTGPTFGANIVSLIGGKLDPNPVEILFGSEPADLGTLVEIVPNQVYEVVAPSVFSEGVVDVIYVNPGTPNPVPCTLVSGYEYKNPPTGCTMTAINPPTGGRQGGTWVTIDGLDFCDQASGGVRVFFDSYMANPQYTVVTGTTQIGCYTPGVFRPGPVDVMVIGVGCQTSCILAGGYNYLAGCTISGVSPATGSLAGGELVALSGSNFDPGGQVRFGDNFSANVNFLGPTLIEAVSPPSAVSGPVDVMVMGSLATQCTSVDGFDYVAGPGGGGCTIAAVIPAGGDSFGGYTVTISGSGFEVPPAPPPGVLFGFATADNVSVISPFSLSARVPARLHQINQVDVTVANDNGDTCTLLGGFLYDPVPTCNTECTITSVFPVSGPLSGGNPMAIEGTGFCVGDRAYFTDGVFTIGVPINMASDTMLNCTAPPWPGAPGPVIVTMQQASGHVCWMFDAYDYTGPVVPCNITAINPGSGPVVGGDTVTIDGSGFLPYPVDPVVLFGNEQATIDSVTDIEIVCTTPAGATPGPVRVRITNSSGSMCEVIDGYDYQ